MTSEYPLTFNLNIYEVSLRSVSASNYLAQKQMRHGQTDTALVSNKKRDM